MTRGNDLGKDNVWRLVVGLAVPSMLAQLVNVLYGIVDRMYIGNIPGIGDVALAGVGVCGPVVTLISSFAFLVGIGGAPLLAMRLGEGNPDGAREILYNCAVLLTGISLLLTVVVSLFCRPMLMLFGASEATLPYAEGYLRLYALGSAFAILSVGLNQFIICQGYAKTGMFTVLIGAVLNLLLDPLFIFVFDMGVQGAAIATVLSQLVSFLFVWKVLRGPVHVPLYKTPLRLRIVRRVMLFGLSPFIIIATDSILVIVLNIVLARHGGAQGDSLITCATIAQSYLQLITMPLGGITSGTQPILSFNYGANQLDRIRKGFRGILLLAVLFTSAMFFLSQLLPQYFVLIFTKNPEIIELSVRAIKIFTLGVIPLAFQYTFVDGLTALGIAPVAMGLSLFRKTCFLVQSMVLPIYFGATNAFWAEPGADIFCSVVTSTVFFLLIEGILRRRAAMPKGTALYS